MKMNIDYKTWSSEQEYCPVSIDDHKIELAYRDVGTGEPVVFLHGIPTWSFLWRRISPAFENEFHTIVPDLAGYGKSSRYDGFDRSIRAQEQALTDLLDCLGLEHVSLVAHDIGVGIALRYAEHNPYKVEKLVVSNGVCYDSWPVNFISNLGLPETANMDSEEFENNLDFAFADGTYDDPDPKFVKGMKAPWLDEGGQRAIARAAVATNTNHTTEIDYNEINADVLCLWGANDALQPLEYGERLAADLDGKVVELDRAYHWVVEDRPKAYREELRAFLNENTP
jgi:haloalkane dehalogenase